MRLRCLIGMKAVLCTAAAFVVAVSSVRADVTLPAIFSDHMVLQAAADVPVWGRADAGETVTVTLGRATASAVADAAGKWMLRLDLQAEQGGPHRMRVSGNNTIVIEDVLVGQVWLASGQSNMAAHLRNAIGGEAEVAAGAGNWLREFRVVRATADSPAEDLGGKWVVGEAGKTGSFSAVAYYFAQRLHEELNQPVGIINSSWGSTPSEAWTSAKGLARDPELAAAQSHRNREIVGFAAARTAFIREFEQWTRQHDVADSAFAPAAMFAAPDADLSGWQRLPVSRQIAGVGLPQQGVIWLRCDVDVPATAAGRRLVYTVQEPVGFATYYWNGERVDGPAVWSAEHMRKLEGVGAVRTLRIPSAKVREGANVLAVRLYSPVQPPAAGGPRNEITGAAGFKRYLAGSRPWLVRAEAAFPLSDAALSAAPQQFATPEPLPQQPARVFNAMIAPLVPYGIAGVIWYQGERNVSRADQYRRAFPLLIEDWRTQWGRPDMPFYFCQLANHLAKAAQPAPSAWAELREAQDGALALPRTGQAVLLDIGEADDIHPRNKRDVGLRLARHALRDAYGKAGIVASGPVFVQKTVRDGSVYLRFSDDGPGSELVAQPLPQRYVAKSLNGSTRRLSLPHPGSPLQGFAVCGADGRWVWADADILDTHTVVVRSAQVPEPVAVRYAWADNPTCNLFNAAGLPASAFRTDTFTLSTAGIGY